MSKLELTYLVCSPKSARSIERRAIDTIKLFWLSHWTKYFAETGSPEAGWEEHFDQQDIVVALRLESEIVACHLYSFYDLSLQQTAESDYFSYLKKSSIATLLQRDVTRLMSMEYLGVSPSVSQNAEKLSIGKLMVTLATHVGESIRADAVFGTPIIATSTPKMMANVGAITVEENIEKYGYKLCLQYVPTNPRLNCLDQSIAHRAADLWHSREVINQIGQFPAKKRVA